TAGQFLQSDGDGTFSWDNAVQNIGAGDGLTGGGAAPAGGTVNVDVGQGTGITVAANTISVDRGNAYNASTGISINNSTGAISTNITQNNANGDITAVVAGNGLAGGANAGSATLNVGAGSGITVAANNVALSYSNSNTTNTQPWTGARIASQIAANAGGGGGWDPSSTHTQFLQNDLRNIDYSLSGGNNGRYGYVRIGVNGTRNTGVFELNGNNSWVLQGTSVDSGPIDQDFGRTGEVYGGWFHLPAGQNFSVSRSQQLSLDLTYWSL
ncbi:MAG: hypothetical protein OXE50_16140, partial [Chloroflexi bacterium]|nr:hypothetical protein [Chloroflexota bacterium]